MTLDDIIQGAELEDEEEKAAAAVRTLPSATSTRYDDNNNKSKGAVDMQLHAAEINRQPFLTQRPSAAEGETQDAHARSSHTYRLGSQG